MGERGRLIQDSVVTIQPLLGLPDPLAPADRCQLLDLNVWGCSSAGRAPALQAGGRRFDPDQLHQKRLVTSV
jgi:hypothetical protein